MQSQASYEKEQCSKGNMDLNTVDNLTQLKYSEEEDEESLQLPLLGGKGKTRK